MASPKEVSVIVRAIDEVTGPVREMNTRMKGFVDGIMGIFKGLGAGLAALGLFDFLKDSVKAASESIESWARVGIAVSNAGGDFATMRPQIEAAIESTKRMTTASGTDLREALTTMITMTSDVTGSLKNMGLAADVAAYKHIGVADAAELVGKAMMGNAKVLKQFGIEGGTAGERMAVFAQVMKGFSEEHLKSFPGQLELVSRGWHEVKEATGEAILASDAAGTSTNRVANALAGLHSFVKENEDSISGLTTFVGGLGTVLGFVAHVLGMAFVSALSIATAVAVTFVGGVKEIPDGIQFAFGALLQTIGATGVALKGLLKKVGIDLGDGMAENWVAAGAKMVAGAKASMALTDETIKDSWRDIVRTTEQGQGNVVTATETGHAQVIRLTKTQAAALLAMTEEGYDGLTSAQKQTLRELEAEHKDHGVAIFRMTTEQNKALDAFNKATRSEEKAAAKKQHEELLQAEKDANTAIEDLRRLARDTEFAGMDRHRRAIIELAEKYQDKINKLEDDYNKTHSAAVLKQLNEAKDLQRAAIDHAGTIQNLAEAIALESVTWLGLGTSTEIVGPKIETLHTRLEGMRLTVRNVIDDVDRWADSILAVAQNLGISDNALAQSVASIHEIGDGIKGLHSALSALSAPGLSLGAGISGVLGALSAASGIVKGIGGVLKSIFGGESESARKLRLGLESNAQHIDKLIAATGDLTIALTGKQLSGTQGALKDFFAGGGANAKGWGDKLGQLLLQHGVNMDDLMAVAKTLQIDVSPDGHLSPQALAQLQKALGAIEPTQFAHDFKGKKQQLEAETTLFNLSPEEKAQRLAGIGASELTGATATAVGGLDFSAGGRAGSLGTIQGLFNLMKSGGIATADLGGLQPSEFLQLLEDLKGLIESANQNTGAAGPTTPEGPTANPQPSSGVGLPGPSDTGTPAVDYLATLSTDFKDFVVLESNGFDRLLDIQVGALDSLHLIRDAIAALNPAGGPTAGSAGSGITINIGDIVVEAPDASPGAQAQAAATARAISIELRRQVYEDLKVRGIAVLS